MKTNAYPRAGLRAVLAGLDPNALLEIVSFLRATVPQRSTMRSAVDFATRRLMRERDDASLRARTGASPQAMWSVIGSGYGFEVVSETRRPLA